MNKWIKILGIGAIAAMVLLLAFSPQAPKANPDAPGISGMTIKSTTSSDQVLFDVMSFKTIKRLSGRARFIVVGEVVKKNDHTRNLARNPSNLAEDAKDLRVMSQEYDFKVTKWLKGTGDGTINIVFPATEEYFKGNITRTLLPLVPGQKYVLFMERNPKTGEYFGAYEPWRFKIVGDKVQIVSEFPDLIMQDLPNMTLAELTGQIN